MKKILLLLTIILVGCAGFFFGRYKWYTDINGKPYFYNLEEYYSYEVKYSNALLEGLHWYMRDDSVRWYNTFMNTIEYQNIEKANKGDWEDFYSPEWK